MRPWLFAIVVVASCGDELGGDVPSDGGASEAGVEGGAQDGATADGGAPSDAASADADADAEPYDAPNDVQPKCGIPSVCAPPTGCCVNGTGASCGDDGDCVGATYLRCSVSSQCGTGRCCVRPDDAGTFIAIGQCRAACAPGDLILCDKDDSLPSHGCAADETCSGANLETWGLSGTNLYAGCQAP
jgi:hypothetical protein